ncbi:MAG: tRNA (adenosine(37)-N6)-threonylcarbamoyltransferase complex ATPase subunit type 1 TsaE [Myxococcales bacterium]|nr:tRNA (adenosine(37)-N6)-threonylcarbamoyltransferase complex ATPase subunit type 1 TsaE [Myxococcales bacterium]
MPEVTLDEEGLCASARALGAALRGGEVLLLDGPMGAGKTTFTRALAVGLGVEHPERVRSPSFALCVEHEGPRPLVHIDLFRVDLDDREATSGHAAFEALGLDFDELGGPRRVLVIEWAERWSDPPDDHLAIRIDRVTGAPSVRRLSATSRLPPHPALEAWLASLQETSDGGVSRPQKQAEAREK